MICQANPGNRQKQSDYNAGRNVTRRREPLAAFQHLRCLPPETRKCRVAAKKADGDRDAPIGRHHHPVQRHLSNQAEKKTPCEINQQRAPGKRARRLNLREHLDAVAQQSSDCPKDRNQYESQRFSDLLLAPRCILSQRASQNEKTPGAVWLPGVISPSISQDGYGELHRRSLSARPVYCVSSRLCRGAAPLRPSLPRCQVLTTVRFLLKMKPIPNLHEHLARV